MSHAGKTLIERPHRVLAKVETVQPQKAVAIAFQHLLPFHVFRLHVETVVRRIDLLKIGEMLLEPVIFDDDRNTFTPATNLEEEIHLIVWMLIGRIELPKIL